ncbi:hypothetical protein LCGC14_2117470 [marine sediment metagenome]|uniref:Uncharacterized protein n=1 Tax=marine sediment metagenome TaxID=412755 RepID=A0A0F9E5A7_9ZZZZ
MKRPTPNKKLDIKKIRVLTEEILDYYESEDFHADRMSDYHHYLVEEIMQLVYGEDVYDWINDQYD